MIKMILYNQKKVLEQNLKECLEAYEEILRVKLYPKNQQEFMKRSLKIFDDVYLDDVTRSDVWPDSKCNNEKSIINTNGKPKKVVVVTSALPQPKLLIINEKQKIDKEIYVEISDNVPNIKSNTDTVINNKSNTDTVTNNKLITDTVTNNKPLKLPSSPKKTSREERKN